MLACHGGAGRQSVWKDEKKSCLETMMNLLEMNFDFVSCSWADASFRVFPVTFLIRGMKIVCSKSLSTVKVRKPKTWSVIFVSFEMPTFLKISF